MSHEIFNKPFEPIHFETERKAFWASKSFYSATRNPDKLPYTIVMPPPNVTGDLTLGHVINNTLQDVLIRWNRGMGKEVCWIPGTDHASIATEAKVTNQLTQNGIDKRKIGREAFLEHAWEWKKNYGGRIVTLLKDLGISCDWNREVFTMDKSYSQSVVKAIVKLYRDGLIYRGNRLVNWCPVSQSVISDEEVLNEERNGNLWHIKYPILHAPGEFLIVATTRPETLFGDLALAVNPEDERYQKYIGKKVILPIANREIPVIADHYVDRSFGTGVVKITPAHDKNDFEVGKRHNLGLLNVMNPDASLNQNVPASYVGLDRFVARKALVKELQELELLDKTEPHKLVIGISERGHVPIEYYLSEQWYIKMDGLAKLALEETRTSRLQFFPAFHEKTWEHWLSNIQDWCISRQLWWGHQMPVYTCQSCKHVMCEESAPGKCDKCGSSEILQDPDCLDTWASAWLWPFGVHSWGHGNDSQRLDLDYFYPTEIIVTGPDIIFFWIARMVMAGKHFTHKLPFKQVYFTPLVRDAKGRKMSKSLGNSPNVHHLIEKYGTDALRFSIVNQIVPGQDIMWADESCELGKNFANKLWNVTRYLIMTSKKVDVDISGLDYESLEKEWNQGSDHSILEKWIVAEFFGLVNTCHENIKNLNFAGYTFALYEFTWMIFCDWFVELSKPLFSEAEASVTSKSTVLTACGILDGLLRLIHPIMPFVTEEIWQNLNTERKENTIGFCKIPDFRVTESNHLLRDGMRKIQSVVSSIRAIRGQYKIHPATVLNVTLKCDASVFANFLPQLEFLSKAKIGFSSVSADLHAVALSGDLEVFVCIEGIVSVEEEKSRLDKRKEKTKQTLANLYKKLSNEEFVKGAPPLILEGARRQLLENEKELFVLDTAISRLL